MNDSWFWSKVFAEDSAACWRWTGGLNRNGYGRIGPRNPGKTRLAHRISYEMCVGPIPEGLTLDHLCRNPACVNPSHLEPVTQQENLARGEGIGVKNKRKTHCKHGHKLTPENIYRVPKGRLCLRCKQQRTNEYNAKISAQRAAKRALR
jgi:hypothetical protein